MITLYLDISPTIVNHVIYVMLIIQTKHNITAGIMNLKTDSSLDRI